MADTKEADVGVVPLGTVKSEQFPKDDLSDSIHRDYAGAQAKRDPAEIRLVRKLDFRIMPVLWFMYFFNYVDRGALAQARLNNLERDLGMRGENFNTAVSVLTVGYVLMQIPSNMVLTRVRPSFYLSTCMVIWSVVSTCTGFVNSYGSLLACRFLLGFFEAPFYPGALYLLSVFYKRKEVATRVAILYSAQMGGLSFANLIAAGVFSGLDGKRGIAGWRWMLILEGVASALVAIFGFFLLPNRIESTRWLSEDERDLAQHRMEADRLIDAQEHESVKDALVRAICDRRTWLFCLLQNLHYAGLSFINFLPTVIVALKYSSNNALLLACPPYIGAGLATLTLAWSSGHFHERTLHITGGFILAIIGFVAAASTLNPAGRYAACFIFAAGAYSVNSVIVGWIATTLSQSQERKAVTLAMTNVSSQIAAIYGPYFWPSSDGPRYTLGFSASAAFSFASMLLAWVMRYLLKRENVRIKEGLATGRTVNTYGY
ncbi:major facilitator superfamily protein [Thozetella sp. PMI_491]|nr:major facilitator superfamily protein [Thozetella sp. PMI_491]